MDSPGIIRSEVDVDELRSRAPWFRTGPFVLVSSVVFFAYALLGSFFPAYRIIADKVVSPLIDSLGWVFLEVRTSPMIGELDPVYYRNIMGLCIFFTALYNLLSLLYMVKFRRVAAISCEEAHRRMVALRGISVRKAWVLLHVYVYVFVVLLAAAITFSFLNNMFGWLRVTVNKGDIFFELFVWFTLILPSGTSVAMWSIVGQYGLFDVRKIIDFISK
ncbi:hypothetical protein SAMN05216598_3884 [Pseudomonas asplenii]|uniref:Uncharacterized protein n=1 Tax=Pseudomonas asplenii TaxID=53407 RepID=A0A1H1XF61_9PSED|nr:hypothetical protein [Pseudomonas asplenii]SDT07943.1 hypothetical protein SAMN05216598_3884 [Pseudomonas asplenii]